MSHGRIVPTDRDGVENRFPGGENPTDVYNRNRCGVCGVPWPEHDAASLGCAGRRPQGTLFDVGDNGPKHKGAYG